MATRYYTSMKPNEILLIGSVQLRIIETNKRKSVLLVEADEQIQIEKLGVKSASTIQRE